MIQRHFEIKNSINAAPLEIKKSSNAAPSLINKSSNVAQLHKYKQKKLAQQNLLPFCKQKNGVFTLPSRHPRVVVVWGLAL